MDGYLHHVSTDLGDILVLLLQRQSTIIIFHFRKQYRSQNVAGTFKIDGKVRIFNKKKYLDKLLSKSQVREAEQDRRGQLRGGVQVPGAGHRPPRRHQEVRGERG